MLNEMLPVFEEEAPVLSEAAGVTLTAVLAASVPLAVPEGVAVPVAVSVGDTLALALPLSEVLPVRDGEAPKLSAAVGDALTVELPDMEVLAVLDGVPELDGVPVAVGMPKSVAAAVAVLLKDAPLPVFDGEEALLSEGVGEALTVVLAETVLLAVLDGVGVPDKVPVLVKVAS